MVAETLIITALGFIIRGIKNSKGGKQASDEMSVAVWDWVRPIFLEKDESAVRKLEEDPERFSVLGEHLLDELSKNNDFKNSLNEWVEKLSKDDSQKATGTTTMYHTGSGDNVGRDKIVHR